MRSHELVAYWLNQHNGKYINYHFNCKEPRWHTKQFFLYSYNLFLRLNENGNWSEYLNNYSDIFRRDPANDYYGYRDPNHSDSDKARSNSLEWSNIFEIVHLVGFPWNQSAKEKMLYRSKKVLLNLNEPIAAKYQDIMLCAAVEFLPEYFKEIDYNLFNWIEKYTEVNLVSPHQLIAYLNVLKIYPEYKILKDKLFHKLISWINGSTGTTRRQILIWARIYTRLDWCSELQELEGVIKSNFLRCLEDIHEIEWYNTPIILEALYKASNLEKRRQINDKISAAITPSIFFKLKDIFPFLNDFDELQELQNEVEHIKEKCRQSPSIELCQKCINEQQGDCWIRILSKIIGIDPWTHSGFEIADVVVYVLERGIYFVIKSSPIVNQRGEGDVLYRQCTQLFSNDHALVFYWNPYDTKPMVIENIRRIASRTITNPRFEVINKKYIRQVYRYYKENLIKSDKARMGRSLFDF